MSFKILIYIAILYVVKASVITLNTNEAEGSPLIDDTNNDVAAEVEQTFDGDSASEIVDLVSDFHKPPRCTARFCNRICRLLRFDNGTCVDGQCKCSGKGDVMEDPNLISENADLFKRPRCTVRFCNLACRLLRFSNGTCVNGRCQCSGKAKDTSFSDDTFNNEDEEDKQILDAFEENLMEDEGGFLEYTELFNIPRCTARLCNRACRLLRFENGTCVNGRCQCSGKAKDTSLSDDTFNNEDEEAKQILDAVEENLMEDEGGFLEYTELFNIPRCTARLCNRACRLLRFENGTCVNGRCQCSGKENNIEKASPITDPADFSAIPRCTARICNRACRLLRFDNGTCVNGQCKCSGKGTLTGDGTPNGDIEQEDLVLTANSEDNVMDIKETDSNHFDSPKTLKCIPRICDRLCRLLRFDSGTCVEGRCKCAKKDSPTLEKIVDTKIDESYLMNDEE